MTNFGLPIVTISLVRGNALGGGFEIALSGDVIIAERSAMMGFPEILFNCFPGMGAFQTLSSRVGLNKAHKLISSGNLYSAEELYDMGVVDVLVDDHCGEEAVYCYVQNHNKNWNGNMAMQKIVQSMLIIYVLIIDKSLRYLHQQVLRSRKLVQYPSFVAID